MASFLKFSRKKKLLDDAENITNSLEQSLPAGNYWFLCETVNDNDGAICNTKGKIHVNLLHKFKGEVQIDDEDEPQKSSYGTWKGRTTHKGKIRFIEKLDSYEGKFIYKGRLDSTAGDISGTYVWREYPDCTGTFKLKLYHTPKVIEEQERAQKQIKKILPSKLLGINNFNADLHGFRFCWRWIYANNGDEYRFITLEQSEEPISDDTNYDDEEEEEEESDDDEDYGEEGDESSDDAGAPPEKKKSYIRPRDFMGINGYADDLKNAFFCWRRIKKRRVLTLEIPSEVSGTSHAGSASITPNMLAGVNGYSLEAKSLNFCWRWIDNSEGSSFRGVTLE